VIIAAASKSDAPCRAAVSMCRDRGRIVVVGAVEMSFPWDEMYIKEIQVLMSRAYGPGSYDADYERKGRDYPVSYVRWTENRNMEEFLRLLEARKVDVGPLISRVYPLAEAPAAYDEIMNGAGGSLAMVLRYPQADLPAPVTSTLRQTVFTPNVTAPAPAPGGIRAAVVGVGGIFRWAHMPALEKIPDVSLRAVYSSSGARGKTCAERYNAVYCTTDYEQVLRDRDTNLVIVVSRNQYHASQTTAALRAGKHVFVEKPMALTIDECRDVVQAARESGKQLTVGFNRRFAPYYVAQRKRLMRRSGPAVINIRVNSPGISYPYWMADPAIGGAILGEACHFVDLFYWLLGSEPVRVFAHSLPPGSTEPVGQNNLCATFQFADGSIGTLNYSTMGSKTSQGERVECFAQGFGVTTENFKYLAIHEAASKVEKKLLPRKGYDAQMKSFIEAIREGRRPLVTVVDGVRATLGCLRMLDSARTGEPCDIDLAGVLG
jgi:predicted dehydrogenase